MDMQMPQRWGATDAAEIHTLAERYGTPLYLYDADAVTARIVQIRDALDHAVKVFYAVKANPNLELLRAIRDVSDGLDVSSGGEVEQALLAGYDSRTLSFAGPAKTAAELRHAIENGVGSISIESVRELRQCIDIAKQRGIRANVALRVNPCWLNRAYGIKMGGRSVQFGIDEENIAEALEILQTHGEHIDFRGIHVYAGSQCFEPAAITQGVQHTLRIVQEIEDATKLRCKTINLGGGFGVAHGADRREFDLEALASTLMPVLRSFRRSSRIEREIIFELGRFLVADAGLYVTRVVGSKRSRGKDYFIVDGGLHHHLAAAGTFGAAMRSNYVLQNLTRPHEPAVICNVAGSSCNPTDMLGLDAELPRPEHGDLIAVLGSGSYGLTASPVLFLGHPTPVELVRHRGRVLLGRRAWAMTNFN